MRTLIISAINLMPSLLTTQAAIVSLKLSSEKDYGRSTSVIITPGGSLTSAVFYDVFENVTYNVKAQLICGTDYIQDIFIPIAP